MLITPLTFLPHLTTDSSMGFMLESVRGAYEALENHSPELAKITLKALLDYITSPTFAPEEPPRKERVKFFAEYPPQPTRQTLQRGDCLELIKEVESGSIDCIITDPPYSLGQTANGMKGNFEDLSMIKPFYHALSQEMARVLNDTGEAYIFIDWRGYALLYECLSPYLEIRNLIVWHKFSGAGNHYGFAHELIIFCTKKGYSPNKAGMNVWKIAGFNSGAKRTDGEKIINAQKPTALIGHIIQNGCPQYGTILDPFMGSGTTAVVSRRTQRHFIGFEHNALTFQLAVERCKKEAEENSVFVM